MSKMIASHHPYSPYYCWLCGAPNHVFIGRCDRCRIPHDEVLTRRLVEGWESCNIFCEALENLDDTYERARFLVEIRTVRGNTYAFHTASFTRRIWDSWYPEPPPLPSAEERQIEQSLIDQLHNDGWLDTTAATGEPVRLKYWRYTVESGDE
jgi:hypothetical protein